MGETKTPSASFIEELTKSIEKDDIKTFKGCMEKFPCGSFRLGRFPVLSALYLCRSKKILKAYETQFISVGSWQPLTEPVTLATLFRKTAGKCMRLYLEEVVTPPEMLALTEQTKKLRKTFNKFRLSAAAKQRVKDVYAIKYGLEVRYEDNNAYFPSRPMNKRERNIIIIACAGAFLLAASAVSVPFIVNEFKPFIKDGNGALRVSSFKQIDFDSENSYVLKKDITLDRSFYTANLNCTIDGNGKTITFKGDESAVGLLAGTIKNAVIKTTASVPFINTVDIPGNIQNVTVKADSDVEVGANFGYLVNNNYGTLDGVTLYANGSVDVTRDAEDLTSNSVFVGGIVAVNSSYTYFFDTYYGEIKNCKAVYTDFDLSGVSNADTSFGGIAGQNAGIISYSVTEGSISSDTVDAAGICGLNKNYLRSCENKASITQVSQSLSWNPVCAGITLTNEGPIRYCVNDGNISSRSLLDGVDSDAYPSSVCAGIAGSATAYIYGCTNSGEICAEGSGDTHAGGICGQSYAEIIYCLSEGDISASGNEVYAGGIAGASNAKVVNNSVCFGLAEYCISDCSISANSDKAYIGGIAGYIGSGQIFYTFYQQTVYYGGAIYCLSLSDLSITGGGYSGGIVGVCSAILTDGADGSGNVNTFVWNNITYESLRQNVFIKSDGTQNAAGTKVTITEEEITYGDSSDAGATFDTGDNIKASELYSVICDNLTEKEN